LVAYLPLLIGFGPSHWFAWGPFAIQASRVLLYAAYFFAGVAMGPAARIPGRRPAVLAAGLFAALLAVQICRLHVPGLVPRIAWLVLYGVAFALFCAAAARALLTLFARFQRRFAIWDSLSANAYGIYLLHYPFVVWGQYALLDADIGAIPKAAGVFTGGTMEAPLLAAADLIVGLGVDPVELIPAAWEYRVPAVLVTEVPAGSATYFTGGAELVAPLPAAIGALASHRNRHTWPEAAGMSAKSAAAGRLRRAAVTAAGHLSPQDVVTTVRAHTPPTAIATVDAGAHMLVAMPLWPVEEPHRLLASSGLATMGFALPAAIAAALCVPGEPVVAFTGDGGLGMALAEIETAVRHRLQVIVVVFNDATLSLIKIKQRPVGQGGGRAVGYGPVSFAGAATAMGAAAASVAGIAGLVAALAQALGREGPTVIDAQVDPAGYPAVMDLTRGAAGRRGVPE